MDEEEAIVANNFPLFSKRKNSHPKQSHQPQQSYTDDDVQGQNPIVSNDRQIEREAPRKDEPRCTFTDLGLPEWATKTCFELGMKVPTPVQQHCIPKILAGNDVLGLAQTGSGKTAAYALPILQRLAENPYGVFALVVTPTRELAYQLAEQFRALGSSLTVRCSVVVGGMNMITQAKTLMQRPHVVVCTPGRIKVLLEDNPDIPSVFSRTKFLVLDEADRVLDAEFEEELRVIFKYLPKKRQTLLFSATMTEDLTTLHELSSNKAFFSEAYAGLEIADNLRQQYLLLPKHIKDVYLQHILSKIEDMGVRSVIVFVSEKMTCHRLALLLEELDQEVAELNSILSQSARLASVHRFKSGQVPILLTTEVGGRGLDIPTVDLVINYDVPSCAADYVHRAGRTARAGRGGLVVSFVTANEVDLIHEIEAKLGKKVEEFECKEKEALANFTKVVKARRVVGMKMNDDGFEERVKARKEQKVKTLAEKGLLNKNNRKRKRTRDK